VREGFALIRFATTVLLGALACGGAAAGDGPARVAEIPPGAPDCYCRAQGRIFGIGDTICLRGPQGSRMARCSMELNVTSWRLSEQPCPES